MRKYLKPATMDDLSDDLLNNEIFNRLDVASWGCCKAVCTRWKTMLSNKPPPVNEIPSQCDLDFKTSNYIIKDFVQNTLREAQLPRQMLKDLRNAPNHGYRCMGSFGSWLILIIYVNRGAHDGVLAYLFNPLSLEHRRLPPLYWVNTDDYSYLLARMSCPPTESNLSSSKCGVVVFSSYKQEVYVCKPTDNEWTQLPTDDLWEDWEETTYVIIIDAAIAFRSGRLLVFLMDVDTQLIVFDVEGHALSIVCQSVENKICKLFGNEAEEEAEEEEEEHMFFNLAVDCSGGLFVVGQSKDDNGATRIVVLKLQQRKLVGVDNLGGGMIFIGQYATLCSRFACASGFFVKDCVYYLHDGDRGDDYRGRGYTVSRFPVNQPSQFTRPKTYSFFPKREIHWFMPMIT